MQNINPTLRLHKPPMRRADSCRLADGLRLLWAWRQAWDRVHGPRERRVTRSYGTAFTGKRGRLEVPPLVSPCNCDQPVQCATDGNGGLIQQCPRCLASNKVARRHGLVIVRDGGQP